MADVQCENTLPGISVFETGEKIRHWLDTGLENYERLEIFYSLLSTMTNLEVRYFHSILHSFMGRDWQQSVVEAQELVRRTNDTFSLRDLYGNMDPQFLLTNEITRNQVILDLSVLHPVSTSCADIICDFIDRAGIPFHAGHIEDDQILSDLLMIVSMSFRHPAFRFHWRVRLGQLAVELVGQRLSCAKPPRPLNSIPVTETSPKDRPTTLPSPQITALNDTRLPGGDGSSFPVHEPSQSRESLPQPVVDLSSTSGQPTHQCPTAPSQYSPKLKSMSDTNVLVNNSAADAVPAVKTAGSMGFVTSRSVANPVDVSSEHVPGGTEVTQLTTVIHDSLEAVAESTPWTSTKTKTVKLKSCYNCGSCEHWGQDCQKKSYWEWDPYSDAVDYCMSTDDAYRHPPAVFQGSEVYYAQRPSKEWTNK